MFLGPPEKVDGKIVTLPTLLRSEDASEFKNSLTT
jgi:hypothetical protein